MPTLFGSDVDVRLLRFSAELAAAARLFTSRQLARHPDLVWRTQPERRAREFIRMHTDVFEAAGAPRGEHVRWRLTKEARRRYKAPGVVQGLSEKAYHWLGLGDVWIALTLAGGSPEEWMVDVDHQFDVKFKWCGSMYLLEFQRTPLAAKRWAEKWKQRRDWYKAQKWTVRPWVVLVNTAGQPDETVRAPTNTIHVRSIEELPSRLIDTCT